MDRKDKKITNEEGIYNNAKDINNVALQMVVMLAKIRALEELTRETEANCKWAHSRIDRLGDRIGNDR